MTVWDSQIRVSVHAISSNNHRGHIILGERCSNRSPLNIISVLSIFGNRLSGWLAKGGHWDRLHSNYLRRVHRIYHLYVLEVNGDTGCCSHNTAYDDRRP